MNDQGEKAPESVSGMSTNKLDKSTITLRFSYLNDGLITPEDFIDRRVLSVDLGPIGEGFATLTLAPKETDLDRLKIVLDEMGVVYNKEVTEHEPPVTVGQTQIFVEEGGGPKNEGYIGFYTSFLFDCRGNLIKMGAYE